MSKNAKIISIIIAVAIALRVAAAIWHPMVDRAVYPDAGDYHDLAKAIVAGEEYRCSGGIATRMPGYPVAIAGVYAIAGAKPIAMLIAQALMGGGICWMIWRMLRSASERAAIIAAGLFAIDPLSIGLSASLLSESPFALALVGIVWLGLKLLDRQGGSDVPWGFWIALGITSAAAIYMRGAALYLPAVFVAMLLARRATWRSVLSGVAALLLVIAAIFPWKIFISRHDETAGLRGLTSLEGVSLYEAVYEHATGGPMQGEIIKTEAFSIRVMREAERDAYYRDAAWKEIREHPWRVIGLAPVKFARFWSPGLNESTLASTTVNAGLWVWHVPLFLLAIFGALGGALRGRRLMMVLLPILYFTALHMIFIGSVRYRVPLQPLICMLAGMGAMRLIALKNKTTETTTV